MYYYVRNSSKVGMMSLEEVDGTGEILKTVRFTLGGIMEKLAALETADHSVEIRGLDKIVQAQQAEQARQLQLLFGN